MWSPSSCREEGTWVRQRRRATAAAQSSKGTCSAEYIITLLSSSCLPGAGWGGHKKQGEGELWGEQGCFGDRGAVCGVAGAPVNQETAPIQREGEGWRQNPSSATPAALGPPEPMARPPPKHLKGDGDPPEQPPHRSSAPSPSHTPLCPAPPLQERHLRTLR